MNYSPSSRDAIDEHCREVIRSCLNIVEQHGDTYVAIHKDDDIECIVLVSMIRSYDNTVEHTVGEVNGSYWFKVDIGSQEGESNYEEEP